MNSLFGRKTKRLIGVMLALLMVVSLAQPVCFAVEDEEYTAQMNALNEKKQAATEQRIKAQNKVAQLKEEQAAVIEEKMALEERNDAALKEIALIAEQIKLVEAEISQTEKNIHKKRQEVDEAKNREQVQLEKYRARIRAMEENGSYNILAVLISCESFSQLLAAFIDYGDIMNSDQMLYDRLVEARQEHEQLEQEYIEYKEECEDRLKEHEKNKADFEKEQKELQKQIEESEKIIEEYTEKIEKAEKEQKAMEAAEAAAAASAANFVASYYAAKAAAQNAGQNTQPQQQTEPQQQQELPVAYGDGEVEYAEPGQVQEQPQQTYTEPAMETYEGATGSGSYVWPFPGHFIITSPFGYRSSTSSYHTGIDIDGYQSGGSPIVAADSGTVIKAEYYGGYGNCIIIDHGNGMSTLYAHLSSMSVGVGSSVSQGQTIGGVGNTGTCYGIDGIHLHFEVLVGGSQTDPLGYLGGYPYSFY